MSAATSALTLTGIVVPVVERMRGGANRRTRSLSLRWRLETDAEGQTDARLGEATSMHEAGGLVGALVIGLVSGWIADLMTGRRHGLLTTLVVGLVGSFLGAFIASVINSGFEAWWRSLTISTVGSAGMLVLLTLVRGRA